MKKEDYFKPRDIELSLSQVEIDILLYAINHCCWDDYDEDEYGGEGIDAACIHLDFIEQQLSY